MPNKKKKKSKSQEVVNDFQLNFSDLSMIAGEGVYSRVKAIMEAPITTNSNGAKLLVPEFPGDWVSSVIKTNLIISSVFGQCAFRLDFYPDRRVAIVGYAPSVGDMYVNPDIRCLSRWCQSNGWKVPEPVDKLVKDNLQFWKYMWNTMIVDSEYLDIKFGVRRSLDMRAMDDTEDRADGRGDDPEITL